MTPWSASASSDRLTDAPSGDGYWFEQDREWLVCRSMTGSWSAAFFLLCVSGMLLAMAIGFIAHSRTVGNPPTRQATLEITVWCMVAPFLVITIPSTFLALPGERTVSFSPTEVRVTRRIAIWSRHPHAPIDHCRRLRVLDRPPWVDLPQAQQHRADTGRLAFDIGRRTIRFAGGLSDEDARRVFQFLVNSVQQFAKSHERS